MLSPLFAPSPLRPRYLHTFHLRNLFIFDTNLCTRPKSLTHGLKSVNIKQFSVICYKCYE